MAREQVKKSVRFEVFNRDSFTCQYCGEKSPDVVFEIDHITPVAERMVDFAKCVNSWAIFRNTIQAEVRQIYARDEEAMDGTHP